eukprot:4457052-Prymnesium_polylepis.2
MARRAPCEPWRTRLCVGLRLRACARARVVLQCARVGGPVSREIHAYPFLTAPSRRWRRRCASRSLSTRRGWGSCTASASCAV